MLTNSPTAKRPGPKETPAGNVYVFAHQAYWGFRFLAGKRKTLWQWLLDATTVEQIRKLGRVCANMRLMAGASYGAAGLMTWLENDFVARQVLAAKKHRRYPGSERPSSVDRRMISLAIAVGAGVWEIEFATALRKLAEDNLGIEHMAWEVHELDRFHEFLRKNSFVMAVPLGNFFAPKGNGEFRQIEEFPCKVPANVRTGFIIYGYGPNGPRATFSRTLPSELLDSRGDEGNPSPRVPPDGFLKL